MKKQYWKANPDSGKLAAMWPGLVGADKRLLTLGPFLRKQLDGHGCKRVLDSGAGIFSDSIYLLKNGFSVVSNEIDPAFRKIGLENARRAGVKPDVTSCGWTALSRKFPAGSFDAVLCIGNNACLVDENARRRAVRQFSYVLRPGGIIIIDERNFPYILREAGKIMRGNFRYSGKVIYCGDEVHGRPVEISGSGIRMEYRGRDGTAAHLDIYALKRGELPMLLFESNFKDVL